jgi:hypothetical protein
MGIVDVPFGAAADATAVAAEFERANYDDDTR